MVNLESGRMKSREGNVIDADDLLDEMESLALKEIESRYKDVQKKEKQERTKAVSQAAIRYFFLKVEKIKDIVFKPEESIKFEGDTGPYLLYTYARARSILRKAKYKQKKLSGMSSINEQEKQIILLLSKFQDIIKSASSQLAPNLIAHYAYHLSQSFNEFYHSNKVIGSDNEKFRLALTDAISQIIKNSLHLLGINTIEKM
jgi:arginyl-tRNA synthetase